MTVYLPATQSVRSQEGVSFRFSSNSTIRMVLRVSSGMNSQQNLYRYTSSIVLIMQSGTIWEYRISLFTIVSIVLFRKTMSLNGVVREKKESSKV